MIFFQNQQLEVVYKYQKQSKEYVIYAFPPILLIIFGIKKLLTDDNIKNIITSKLSIFINVGIQSGGEVKSKLFQLLIQKELHF